MLVVLPSGNRALLRVPDFTDWLEAGGTPRRLVERLWDDDNTVPATYEYVDDDDACFVYRWAAERFPVEAVETLAGIAHYLHALPSAYLGVHDRVVAVVIDNRVAAFIAESQQDEHTPSEVGEVARMDDPL